MTDQSVYHAQSQCKHAGLERLHKRHILPNGHVIRVYRDNFQQYRGVLFKSGAHHKGYAGLCLDCHGYVRHYECAPAMVAYNAKATLINFLRSIGIQVLQGDNDMNITEKQIQSFIDGYLTAALWSSTDTIYPVGKQTIQDIHASSKRAEVTYKKNGDTLKGLAINNANKGIGPSGVWFVCVDNFANRIPLTDIVSVQSVER